MHWLMVHLFPLTPALLARVVLTGDVTLLQVTLFFTLPDKLTSTAAVDQSDPSPSETTTVNRPNHVVRMPETFSLVTHV